MAKADLSTLPTELREEIWKLALLPDPSVYCLPPRRGFKADTKGWIIPKRRYPTAMHLCQESRYVALHIMEREKEQEREQGHDGSSTQPPPIYYLGCDAPPFDPEIDTLWLDTITPRISRSVLNSTKLASGQKWINAIKNLAISPDYIKGIAEGGVRPGNRIRSWLDMPWYEEMRLFGSIRRVDVVLGTTWFNRDTVYESEGFYI